MQRIFWVMLCFIIIMTLTTTAAKADLGIAIYVNDQLIAMDTMPYLDSGTTLVPIRFVSTELGAAVTWKDSKANIVYGDTTITMQENSNIVYVNGSQETIPLPVQMRNNRLFVPLRFISEQFGAKVDYQNYEVSIDTGHDSLHGKSYSSPFAFADTKDGFYVMDYDTTNNSYIASIDKDRFTKTVLFNVSSSTSLNKIGNHIYYDDEGKLICYDLQTGEKKVLVEKAYRTYVTKDSIYYLDTYNYQGGLWRMDIDGSNKEQIAKDADSYLVVGDMVYYTMPGKLFKVTTKGNNNQKIADNFNFVDYSNGYFYAVSDEPLNNSDTYRALIRMKEDGSERSIILGLENDRRFDQIKVVGNWIYYAPVIYTGNHADTYTDNLYRVNLDGQQKEQLTQAKANYFRVFKGGFCYYHDF